MSEEQVVPEATEDDFDAGFSIEPPAATQTPAASEASAAEPTEPPVATEAPKLAEMTEDQFRALLDKAEQVDTIQTSLAKQFGTAFGKIGGLERVITQLQSQTPTGIKVEVTDDVVEELSKEFPEIGALQLAAFKKFAEKISGTLGAPVTAQAPQTIDTDAIKSQMKRENAEEELNDQHPGWQQIVGFPDATGKEPDNPFRKWLNTQPVDYQVRVKNAFSPVVIGKAITAFNDAEKKAKVLADARRARINAGVTPREQAGAVTPSKTEDDEFNAGFKG